VELDEVRVVGVQGPGEAVGEALNQRAAQVAAGNFDVLYFGKLGSGRVIGHIS